MFSCKFGRLISGLGIPKTTSVCGMKPIRFSWTAVCQRRALQKSQQGTEPCHVSVRPSSHASVDPDEVRRFQLLATKWWDEQGEFAALHAMNDLRVPFIRDNLLSVHTKNHPGRPLAGLKILDAGCGGGLLAEPLGRLGASVLGIDPVEDSVNTAQVHASRDPKLRGRVRYQACTLEELSAEEEGEEEEEEAETGRFDAVVASEVVEHLADLETFAFCCNHVLKPGGSLFITTINKTNLSFALGIVVAEQLLRIVPRGTHDWEKFISPEELERLLESNGFSVQSVLGMLFNPLSGAWSWTNSTAINYALHAVKVREDVQPEGREEEEEEEEKESQGTGTQS